MVSLKHAPLVVASGAPHSHALDARQAGQPSVQLASLSERHSSFVHGWSPSHSSLTGSRLCEMVPSQRPAAQVSSVRRIAGTNS